MAKEKPADAEEAHSEWIAALTKYREAGKLVKVAAAELKSAQGSELQANLDEQEKHAAMLRTYEKLKMLPTET